MNEQGGPDEVLRFWFGAPATDAGELRQKMKRWFQGGPEMDVEVTQRFSQHVEDAVTGKLDAWLAHPKGWLALILVLDQFTRNVLRNNPRMYAGDARAQALALEALDSGSARALPIEERNFAIMPLVHAESLPMQERGVVEMASLVEDAPEALRPIFGMGIEQTQKYRSVIARFGRFPHRNTLLGRTSTPEEIEFLRDWAERQPPKDMPKDKPA